MKTPSLIPFTALAVLISGPALAGPRTSANYTLATDTVDAGGRRTTSASYANDATVGGLAGISTVASPVETVKHGYAGQLYEVTGLLVSPASPNVNETATVSMAAWQFLDDATLLAMPAANVGWSVVGGPLSGISTGGVATAGVVYQNTAATVQGSAGGFTGNANLTVLDTVADNFGTYAADGVGDDWQVQYYGIDNPNAAPGTVSDGSGHTNHFKFVAGLVPGNEASRFLLGILGESVQPGQRQISFSPVVSGRTYTLTFKSDLNSATWMPVPGVTAADDGTERTLTDPNALGGQKFYRIEITKP